MAQPRQGHVLVVDDDVLIRALMAGLLRGAGLHVIEAANADEAWGYLQAGAPVDLVFSDVEMPGSMHGVELARRVRAHAPALGVILTSGSRDARLAQGFTFLPKPYRLGEALSLILETLHAEEPGRS